MYVSTSSSSSNETRSTYHCTSTSDYEETTDILIMNDSPFYGNLADVTDDNENDAKPIENEERLEPEFNATSDESDDDFNQETEEELLDIPTFLRRQAN